jgi:hypothetical protein
LCICYFGEANKRYTKRSGRPKTGVIDIRVIAAQPHRTLQPSGTHSQRNWTGSRKICIPARIGPFVDSQRIRLAGGALAEVSGAEVRVMSYIVTVGYDEAARRCYVISSDIPGLNVETDTFEEFVEVVQDVVPDLVGDHATGAKIKFEREIALA